MNLIKNASRNSTTPIATLGIAVLVVLAQELSSTTVEAALLRTKSREIVGEEKGEMKENAGRNVVMQVGDAKEKATVSNIKRFLTSSEEERLLLGDTPLEENDYLLAILLSVECSSFMESIGRATETFLEYSDDAILEYICNPIQLQRLIEQEKKMEQDVANDDDDDYGALSCALAFEMKLMEHEELLLDAFSSPETCRETIAKGTAIFHDTRRALVEEYDVEGDDRRELLNIATLIPLIEACLEAISLSTDAIVELQNAAIFAITLSAISNVLMSYSDGIRAISKNF